MKWQENKEPLYKIYGINLEECKDIRLSDEFLSTTTCNKLARSDVRTLYDLIKKSECDLRQLRNFGKMAFAEVDEFAKGLTEPGVIQNLKELYGDKIEVKKIDFAKIVGNIPDKFLDFSIGKIFKYSKAEMSLESTFPCKDLSLREYLNTNKFDVIDRDFVDVLKWCSIEPGYFKKQFEEFFTGEYLTFKGRETIRLRAKGKTLQETGNHIGNTRERVRQIESHSCLTFSDWADKQCYIQKLFLLLEVDGLVFDEKLKEIYEEDYEIAHHLLANCRLFGNYRYDVNLQAFTVLYGTDVDELLLKVKKELPNIISIKDKDQTIEKYAKQNNYSAILIERIVDRVFDIQGNVIYKGSYKLEIFYPWIVKEYFPNGMHIYSNDQMAKFKEYYKQEFDLDLTNTADRSIQSIVGRECALVGRGIYIYDDGKQYLDEQLKGKIIKYLKDNFSDPNTTIIMINTVFAAFEKELRAVGVNNKYFLQGVLKREIKQDEWYYTRDYVTKDLNCTTITNSICQFIKESKVPISKQKIKEKFPAVTDIVLSFATTSEGILNYFAYYYHVCHLKMTDEEKAYLNQIIEDCLKEDDFCYTQTIYAHIKKERPKLLEDQYVYYPYSLFSLLQYLFKDQYKFDRPLIGRKDFDLSSVNSIFDAKFKEEEDIEVSSLATLARSKSIIINSLINLINSHNDTHLLVDKETLVPISKIGINEQIYSEVEKMILAEVKNKDSKAISNLKCIDKLPKIKYEWNEWLIYSCVNKYSTVLEVGLSNMRYGYSYPLIWKSKS